MEDNQDPYTGNKPTIESAGNVFPSLLDDVIDTAIMHNKNGFKDGEHNSDEWQTTSDASNSLTLTLREQKYVGARVYVAHSENDTGFMQEDYCEIVDFAPYRVESDFSGGDLIQEEGWEVGLRVRTKKPSDPSSDNDGFIYKTISFNDPHFNIELDEDRQRRISREAYAMLVARCAGTTILGHCSNLEWYLQNNTLRHQKVKAVGKIAKKLLNSKVCRNDQAAQQSVGSMIMHAYGPGRYQFMQGSVTEFVTDPTEDDDGLPRLTQQEVSKRSKELVDGNLKSVVILPRLQSRKKILIPNFVVEPAGDSSRSLIIPLERNNSMARMSD